MTRPFFETDEQMALEREVMEKVCHAWRCCAAKLPIKYHLDYALHRDKDVIAWCEIRIREYSFARLEELGGYMLALSKWEYAGQLVQYTKRPFVLVVKATDATRAAVFEELPDLAPSISGRASPRDWQDIEPCVFIPIADFKRVIA